MARVGGLSAAGGREQPAIAASAAAVPQGLARPLVAARREDRP